MAREDGHHRRCLVEVQARRLGMRRGGKCVAVPRATTVARCNRWLWLGSLTHGDVAGVNRLRFDGRIGGRALAPGVYRLELTATNAAGERGATAMGRFTIVG